MSISTDTVAATFGLIVSALPVPSDAHSLDSLQQEFLQKEQYFQIKDEAAPEFILQDADGKPVRLSDLHGKVVVLNFIYTNCKDVCPLHAEKIAEVQGMVNISAMKALVEFVTVTTDPMRDSPGVLRAYGPIHGLDPVNWVFLTSGAEHPEDTTRKLAERFGHKFTKGDDGVQMHGVVTHVIDREGRWRANFHGLEFNSTNLVLYVNALTNDVHKPGETSEPPQSWWQRMLSWF